MKRQKGQVIIEFALVLPLFLILLFGIIYCGMLFYDYISIGNIARSAAREAAVVEDFDANKSEIETRYSSKLTFLTSLYNVEPDPITHTRVALTPATVTTENDTVEVKIVMKCQASSILLQMILPENYTIDYYMRRDPQPTTTTPTTPTTPITPTE